MINKLKLGLFAFSILAILSMASDANAQAVNLTSSVSVTIGGNNYTIDSGAGATTIVVGSASITLTVPAASTAVFASLDRFDLDNDSSLTQTCTDTFSYLTITGAATVVITPDTTNVCSGGSGGSGGGGGGSTTKPKTPMTPATPVPVVCISGQLFNPSTGQRCTVSVGASGVNSVSPATGANVGAAKWYNFGTVTLKNGSTGAAVMELQRFLNAKLNLGLVVDGKLGPKTIAVIKTWQMNNGLVADGLVGPMTKAKMNLQAAQ